MTFEQLVGMQDAVHVYRVQRERASTIPSDRRKYAALNHQVIRTGHTSNRRAMGVWSRLGLQVEGALGMSAHARVARNFTHSTPRAVAPQKYRPARMPEAQYIHGDGRKRGPGTACEGACSTQRTQRTVSASTSAVSVLAGIFGTAATARMERAA
jgi:hypothetical protein